MNDEHVRFGVALRVEPQSRRAVSYSFNVHKGIMRSDRASRIGVWCLRLWLFCLLLVQGSPVLFARSLDRSISDETKVLSADSDSGARFVAVHGRHSVMMGYSSQGLEAWAYPFQILSGYRVGFRPLGAATEIDGRALLRRVDYLAESITRTYIGPDYLVREKIFVPLDLPAVVITIEVEGATPVDVAIHFQPVMDLMWPGAVGGQYARWNAEIPGYLITEPEHGFSASVSSPDTVSHDDTVNSTLHQQTSLSFVVKPHANKGRAASASVYIVLNEANTKTPALALHNLSTHVDESIQKATEHYSDLASHALRIETPDREVNEAVRWAEVELDQAWVCNPLLGCGIVAGYGPSRDARRPQYAWFFAGDGLVATNALIAAGEYDRAKEELTFITKYQEPHTGMLWHELSQSAGYIDWTKYPYMYVHVDITPDYLAAVTRYVEASGDTAFAREHWASILKAYGYTRSLIHSTDHLPHIPHGKEGFDEQARPDDDLSLSSGVLVALDSFAELARLCGHTELPAGHAAERAALRLAIATHYWDNASDFWIDGHTQTGAPIVSRRLGAMQLIAQKVFSTEQSDSLLRQIASSDFRTDWGVRQVALTSPDFDPYSYSRGSVMAPATARTAAAFWMNHHPEVGLSIWRDLLPWSHLDSLGHMHELLAGTFFHEQTESVPEQTWSSASFLDATVVGLLGLGVHAVENRIDFMPHLPPEWDHVSIENIRLNHSTARFTLTQSSDAVDLEIDNEGASTQLDFKPRIPFGAHLLRADYQGLTIPAKTESFAEDEHAVLTLSVPSGKSHCHLQLEGGLSILEERPRIKVGDPSTRMKITSLRLQDHTLTIEADVYPQGEALLLLRTPWKLANSKGATSHVMRNGDYEIQISPSQDLRKGGYSHALSTLTFVDH